MSRRIEIGKEKRNWVAYLKPCGVITCAFKTCCNNSDYCFELLEIPSFLPSIFTYD